MDIWDSTPIKNITNTHSSRRYQTRNNEATETAIEVFSKHEHKIHQATNRILFSITSLLLFLIITSIAILVPLLYFGNFQHTTDEVLHIVRQELIYGRKVKSKILSLHGLAGCASFTPFTDPYASNEYLSSLRIDNIYYQSTLCSSYVNGNCVLDDKIVLIGKICHDCTSMLRSALPYKQKFLTLVTQSISFINDAQSICTNAVYLSNLERMQTLSTQYIAVVESVLRKIETLNYNSNANDTSFYTVSDTVAATDVAPNRDRYYFFVTYGPLFSLLLILLIIPIFLIPFLMNSKIIQGMFERSWKGTQKENATIQFQIFLLITTLRNMLHTSISPSMRSIRALCNLLLSSNLSNLHHKVLSSMLRISTLMLSCQQSASETASLEASNIDADLIIKRLSLENPSLEKSQIRKFVFRVINNNDNTENDIALIDIRASIESCIETLSYKTALNGTTINTTFGDGCPTLVLCCERRLRHLLLTCIGSALDRTLAGTVDIFVVVKAVEQLGHNLRDPKDTKDANNQGNRSQKATAPMDDTTKEESEYLPSSVTFFNRGRASALDTRIDEQDWNELANQSFSESESHVQDSSSVHRGISKKKGVSYDGLSSGFNGIGNYDISIEIKDSGEENRGDATISYTSIENNISSNTETTIPLVAANKICQSMGGSMHFFSAKNKGCTTILEFRLPGRCRLSDYHPDMKQHYDLLKDTQVVTMALSVAQQQSIQSLLSDVGVSCLHAVNIGSLLSYVATAGKRTVAVFVGDYCTFFDGNISRVFEVIDSEIRTRERVFLEEVDAFIRRRRGRGERNDATGRPKVVIVKYFDTERNSSSEMTVDGEVYKFARQLVSDRMNSFEEVRRMAMKGIFGEVEGRERGERRATVGEARSSAGEARGTVIEGRSTLGEGRENVRRVSISVGMSKGGNVYPLRSLSRKTVLSSLNSEFDQGAVAKKKFFTEEHHMAIYADHENSNDSHPSRESDADGERHEEEDSHEVDSEQNSQTGDHEEEEAESRDRNSSQFSIDEYPKGSIDTVIKHMEGRSTQKLPFCESSDSSLLSSHGSFSPKQKKKTDLSSTANFSSTAKSLAVHFGVTSKIQMVFVSSESILTSKLISSNTSNIVDYQSDINNILCCSLGSIGTGKIANGPNVCHQLSGSTSVVTNGEISADVICGIQENQRLEEYLEKQTTILSSSPTSPILSHDPHRANSACSAIAEPFLSPLNPYNNTSQVKREAPLNSLGVPTPPLRPSFSTTNGGRTSQSSDTIELLTTRKSMNPFSRTQSRSIAPNAQINSWLPAIEGRQNFFVSLEEPIRARYVIELIVRGLEMKPFENNDEYRNWVKTIPFFELRGVRGVKKGGQGAGKRGYWTLPSLDEDKFKYDDVPLDILSVLMKKELVNDCNELLSMPSTYFSEVSCLLEAMRRFVNEKKEKESESNENFSTAALKRQIDRRSPKGGYPDLAAEHEDEGKRVSMTATVLDNMKVEELAQYLLEEIRSRKFKGLEDYTALEMFECEQFMGIIPANSPAPMNTSQATAEKEPSTRSDLEGLSLLLDREGLGGNVEVEVEGKEGRERGEGEMKIIGRNALFDPQYRHLVKPNPGKTHAFTLYKFDKKILKLKVEEKLAGMVAKTLGRKVASLLSISRSIVCETIDRLYSINKLIYMENDMLSANQTRLILNRGKKEGLSVEYYNFNNSDVVSEEMSKLIREWNQFLGMEFNQSSEQTTNPTAWIACVANTKYRLSNSGVEPPPSPHTVPDIDSDVDYNDGTHLSDISLNTANGWGTSPVDFSPLITSPIVDSDIQISVKRISSFSTVFLSLSDIEMVHLSSQYLHSLTGALSQYQKLPSFPTIQQFVASLARNHSSNSLYNNFSHSVSTLRLLAYQFENSTEIRTLYQNDPLGPFLLAISALSVNIKHSGLSNSFLTNAHSHIAAVYNDISVTENFSCSILFHVLRYAHLNVLQFLEYEDYYRNKQEQRENEFDQEEAMPHHMSNVIPSVTTTERRNLCFNEAKKRIVTNILYTDMNMHKILLETIDGLSVAVKREKGGDIDYESKKVRETLLPSVDRLLLHGAYHGDCYLNFSIHERWASRRFRQRLLQNLIEEELELPLSAPVVIPGGSSVSAQSIPQGGYNAAVTMAYYKHTCGFLSVISLKYCKEMGRLFPLTYEKDLLQNLERNKEEWGIKIKSLEK